MTPSRNLASKKRYSKTPRNEPPGPIILIRAPAADGPAPVPVHALYLYLCGDGDAL
jgi:hypothetical protein